MALSGCKSGKDDKIAARVNGEKIYYSQVTRRILYNEIYNNTYKNIMEKAEEEGKEIFAEYEPEPTEYEDVLNDLIKMEVIRQYNKKEGIFTDFDKAKRSSKREYDFNAKDENHKEFHDCLIETAESYGLDESGLLDLYYEHWYDRYNENVCQSHFFYLILSEECTLEDQMFDMFEEFVNGLADKAKIKTEE